MANVRLLIRLQRRLRGRRIQRKRKVFRRQRDTNPLENLTEAEIWDRYRFSTATIMFIVDLIRPLIVSATGRSMALTPLIQVLLALRYYASGAYFSVVGDTLGVSKDATVKAVHRVTRALCEVGKGFISFPTGRRASATKASFFDIAGFPHVIGCIDGTFIRIQAPRENEAEYVNRNGYHSMNVQMTCEAQFRITNCVAKWPGSVHDARMFRTSQLCTNFENGMYDGYLLGDSGYPCRKYLLTPYANADTPSKIRFNSAFGRTRVKIEQTFGILKRRFSCLQKCLRVSPEKACSIILACAILHNIGIDKGEIIPSAENEQFDVQQALADLPAYDGGNAFRDHIRDTYFS